MADYLRIDNEGVAHVDLSALTYAQAAAITEPTVDLGPRCANRETAPMFPTVDPPYRPQLDVPS
jgi:hypothetical protein